MLDTLFLTAAIIGGTVMVCQFVLTLIGMGDHGVDTHGGDFSADAHMGGDLSIDHDTSMVHAADGDNQHPDSTWLFGVLSLRSLVAALAFFGVAGETALSADFNPPLALAIALVAGGAAMYGMFLLMRGMSKLTSSGNERIAGAIGRHATVYIPIPAGGHGLGKVQVTLQNRTVELQAASDEAEILHTGETVEIVSVKNSDTVAVRRVAEPVEA